MSQEILVMNEQEIIAKHKAESDAYEYVKYEVTPRKDFSQCYIAIYEIPPLKANYPYHYHMANTEAFYIISGHGRLQTPHGSRDIKAGDIIVCPPSESGAHKISNGSQLESLRYIDFDTCNSPDVLYYPESNKTGIIIHNQSSTFFRDKDSVDYYDGE